MAYAVFAESGFELLRGEPRSFRSSDDGHRWFCRECGSALFFSRESLPKVRVVTATSLDDLDAFSPDDHIWADRAVPWIRLPEGVPTSASPA